MHTILFLLVSLVFAVPGLSQEQSLTVATLNCYWFFNGEEGKSDIDKPRSSLEYSTKAGHLIGLLPKEAPLFVGVPGNRRRGWRRYFPSSKSNL